MCNKFTQEEWLLFASKECPDSLKSRIIMHAACCEECRDFIRKINLLKTTLASAGQEIVSTPFIQNKQAFARVASDGSTDTSGLESGTLTVPIQYKEGRFVFVKEGLVRKGCAGKYALNPENNGTILRDDEEALILQLSGKMLTVLLADSEPTAYVSLYGGDKASAFCLPGSECSLELYGTDLLELEIRFEG